MHSGESPQDASSSYHRDSSGRSPSHPGSRYPPANVTMSTSSRGGGQAGRGKGGSSSGGAILEAAFVDPAYAWPPVEGQGKNAIELQASTALMRNADPKYKKAGGNGNMNDDDEDIGDEEISLSPSMMSTDDEDEYGNGAGGDGRPKFRVRKV